MLMLKEMKIKEIVSYMRKRSDELTGVSMTIPMSKPVFDYIINLLDSYCLKESLPEKSGNYLCLCDNGMFAVLHYSEKHKKFNCHDESYSTLFAIKVVAWCELPEVPGK